ncbi:MAG: hypothetical protein CSA42_06990 [Gammaproteobacteria bacterium]|nr:MAG: hypothetical protein CSA42_06990 [Gammaproteobacteria bacterium]
MKKFYLLMCVIGTLLPISIFISWINEYGLNLQLLFSAIVSNKIAAFAWADVVVSAVVLVVFILTEGKRKNIPNLWIPIVATFSVGVSLGLPLFLYMKEAKKAH